MRPDRATAGTSGGVHRGSSIAGGVIAIARTLTLLAAFAAPANAQVTPHVETAAEALTEDAGDYSAAYSVSADEAARRLEAQRASIATTDALAAAYGDRLAGLWIEHRPNLRIVVRLTGDAPVEDRQIQAGGMTVPIVFHTGASATRAEVVSAISLWQNDIRAMLVHPPGLGADARTGEMVVLVTESDASDPEARESLAARIAGMTGVPVRVAAYGQADADMSVEGGGRVVGPVDGRRYACTTGFTVTDGSRDGLVTAAHCPDSLDYVDGDGTTVPLAFVDQWGWGFQDVQLNASPISLSPQFYADTAKTALRDVTGVRTRGSTRVGDFLCHRGERTGRSCAEVAMIDFAPAGDLCGGACLPVWVAVRGPVCNGGDSGAPVFDGTTAIGIVKGGTYRADGGCVMYYYMSLDYLPAGWSLKKAG